MARRLETLKGARSDISLNCSERDFSSVTIERMGTNINISVTSTEHYSVSHFASENFISADAAYCCAIYGSGS